MKKTTLLATLLFISMSAVAQNFNFDKMGGVIWQNTYETEMMHSELYKSLHISPFLESVEKIDSSFYVADLKRSKVEYESLGYRRMALPLYLVNNDVKGKVIIQYKTGKYRITLKDVRLVSISGGLGYGELNEMVIGEDGYFTDTFVNTTGLIYHDNFKKWFEFEEVSDDW